MVLRSQLDCTDSRLPGTGVFDLKTRAAISVRRDMWNIEVSNSRYVYFSSALSLFGRLGLGTKSVQRQALLKVSSESIMIYAARPF